MSMTTNLPGVPNNNPDLLTKEMVERAVPPNLKNHVTQQFVDQINNLVADPLVAEQVRNNFINYTGVMKEGKFKLEDYLNAVAFVSYKLMGYSNQDAYFRTFPSRHAHLVAKGTPSKDIAAYVAAYARGKLVNLIMEQSLVPSWVLNQHVYQEAINTQRELMTDPTVSPKVRSDAANSILTHLKKPEGQNFQISMDMKENSGITELKAALRDMAEKQQEMIANGTGVREIAAQPLIEGECVEVQPGEDNKGGTDQAEPG
jgi:hypothetical protein